MLHQWSWTLLRAGLFRLDGGGMFGVLPKTIWSRFVTPDEHNRIPVQANCLLLEDGETKVLIEAGYGDKWSEKERGYWDLERRTVADAVREAGIDPQAIDHVIVTHLHFDHAAGLTELNAAGEPAPVFPNARVHVQKREWDDALANRSTMTRTYLRTHLEPIAHLIETADGEGEILPGITVQPMPGHTWGQQAVRFADEQGVVCFPGDVLPTINHVGPTFSMGYDMEPYTNMQSKHELLVRAEGEGWRLALDHEPGEALVHVAADGGRFTLAPASSI
jgi:glyoxylase-like metal-dependent hydrolase (beta-lactamase superfamily II)